MKSEHIEKVLDDAAYKVVWKDYKPKYEFLGEYITGTMLDPAWDPFEMLEFELMAYNMRGQHGFDVPTEQD